MTNRDMLRVQVSGLCGCGCGKPTRPAPGTDSRRGWVKGQPIPYLFKHRHARHPGVTLLAERFWRRVQRSADANGCWLWTGRRDAAGYGKLDRRPVGGKRGHPSRAHRLSWEMHHGAIPDGLYVCHTCDNPPCVNPAHLWLGTVLDNTRDAKAKNRLRAGRSVCTHGTARGVNSCNDCRRFLRKREIARATMPQWSPRCECGGWTSLQGGCFVCDRIYGLADDPNDIGLGCDGDDEDPDDEPLGCDVCGLAPCLCYGEVEE